MKRNSRWMLTLSILLLFLTTAQSQKKPITKAPAQKTTKTTTAKPSVASKVSSNDVDDEKKVRDMVAFLEYMLNTLGGRGTPTRDKEILITESYAKIFRDSKVQVEDDLDEERVVINNKDIVAYLKDVNFFFSDVRFEFIIENIDKSTLPNGNHFYKVSAKRNLKGTTLSGKAINNTLPRYIEINFSPKDQDLKIVSIYTSGVDEKRALTAWWKSLSYEWQAIFKKQVNLRDSAKFSDIKSIASLENLDLSGNTIIQSIEPLGQLTNLRSLNLAWTKVNDLTPIRNLTELEELNISNTPVTSLSPLKYSSQLKKLDISNTQIFDLSVLERMPDLTLLNVSGSRVIDLTPLTKLTQLVKLNAHDTKISNLRPLERLTQLTDLNLSKTSVQELNSLSALINIRMLNLDSTRIKDISALKTLENLTLLSINFTAVTSLMPLKELNKLEKIYCDQTPIKREVADAFMTNKSSALVIFDSNDLQNWWETLSAEWQALLRASARVGKEPTKEELALIPLLDSINLCEQQSIRDLEPLKKLPHLRIIKAAKTGINNLSALQNHQELTYLDVSGTDVSDLSIISKLKKLKILKANNSKLDKLESVMLPNLEKLYADETVVHDGSAREFLKKNPQCLLLYKSNHLKNWWTNLSTEWESIFTKQMGISAKPSTEELHGLIEKESITIKNAAIVNLKNLKEFIRLKEVNVNETPMGSISPVSALLTVKTLRITNSPIQQIDSLSELKDLEELDISNTPLVDIYPVWRMKNLKKLNCAGTQIKRLDILEGLTNLEYFDCSNTNVTKLNALDYLPLKILKCYNTKINDRTIENFKASHPNCQIMYYR